MSSCIFTGSFDPFTLGHLEMVKRAGKIFDKVYVAVLNNEQKSTMFSVEERVKLIEAAINNVDYAKAMSFDGRAVDGAKSVGASAIIRGIRNGSDMDYEREMAFGNRVLGGIETLFFISETPHISSTLTRELIKHGGKLDMVLTKEQIELLKKFYF